MLGVCAHSLAWWAEGSGLPPSNSEPGLPAGLAGVSCACGTHSSCCCFPEGRPQGLRGGGGRLLPSSSKPGLPTGLAKVSSAHGARSSCSCFPGGHPQGLLERGAMITRLLQGSCLPRWQVAVRSMWEQPPHGVEPSQRCRRLATHCMSCRNVAAPCVQLEASWQR